MAKAYTSGERAPAAIESLVKQLVVTYKAVKLYPPTSTIPRENAREVIVALRQQLRERSGIRLVVTRDSLLFDALPVLPGQPAFSAFARDLYSRKLADIRFHAGVTEEEITAFLAVLSEPAEDIESVGGFEVRLWDRHVDGITVSAISTKVMDADLPEDPGESVAEGDAWPPDDDRIDSLMNDRYNLNPREKRLLIRFVASPKIVSRYLSDLALATAASGPAAALAERVATLARLANGELAEDRHSLFRSLAESVMGLDAETRHKLLTERLLSDARMDDAVAEVIRQLDLDEVCRALAEGLGPDAVGREGVSRALRNLALISMAAREDVEESARTALLGAGVDEDTANTIIEGALPTHLQVSRKSEEPAEETVDGVLKLIELAPSRDLMSDEGDPELKALREEAVANISDGDVIASLVTLATLERRPDVFASILTHVEDDLGMLIEWGDFDIAADAAAALSDLASEPELEESLRARVREVLNALAGPEQVRLIARAMRVFSADSKEHVTCRRLLGLLGGHTIDSLLEVLADEPDMSARKTLVDLVTDLASGYVARLGERVGDPRWYFVRNVVSILGSTRDPAALPFLGRTLRHVDQRVRRETVRALSNIRDRMSDEMLVSALTDDDSQNVQLAARYLGVVGARGAAPALIDVALGDGRGNREIGPRVEAIEALGRMQALDAVGALTELSGRRSILRSGRTREIRAAAESALAAIAAAGKGDAS